MDPIQAAVLARHLGLTDPSARVPAASSRPRRSVGATLRSLATRRTRQPAIPCPATC